MKPTYCIAALGISIFAIPSAFAADGYVTGNVNLRAGPDSSYPRVARLHAGTPVAIEGCVDGWSWCDVAAGSERGWVAGNFLQEEYQGRRVLIPEYGVQIGIPVVSFVFGSYWDDNYRDRSWYGNREHWSQVTPHYQPTAPQGDWHAMHGNTQTHSHAASAGASRGSYAPGHPVHEASVQPALVTTHSAYHERPSKPAVPQHAIANQDHPAAKYAHSVEPSEQHAVESRASAPSPVTARKAPQQPRMVAEHKAADPKATHKPTTEKNAREKKDNNGKDEL